MAGVIEFVLSDAVNVHDPPVDSKATSLNEATPALAVAVSVPAMVHEDEMVIESADPLPVASTTLLESSTETENVGRFDPVVAAPLGDVVKTTFDGAPAADAGDTAAKESPANIRADVAPIAPIDLVIDRIDR
jgi:hypothetical protein